nr:hypothetical protein BHI3_18260 [Bacteriovorax sp. HI3]
MKNPLVKAKAINLDKEKVFLAGVALLIAIISALVIMPMAHAKDCEQAKLSAQEEVILPPFELKSQKLGH